MEDVCLRIEYSDASLVWIPVLLNMLACKSRMVPHVTVGTIDPWILAILVNAKRAANPMDVELLLL